MCVVSGASGVSLSLSQSSQPGHSRPVQEHFILYSLHWRTYCYSIDTHNHKAQGIYLSIYLSIYILCFHQKKQQQATSPFSTLSIHPSIHDEPTLWSQELNTQAHLKLSNLQCKFYLAAFSARGAYCMCGCTWPNSSRLTLESNPST